MKNYPSFRAWGSATWLLPLLPLQKWVAIGCIATESRSGHSLANLSSSTIARVVVRIRDPQSIDHTREQKLLDESEAIAASIDSGSLHVTEEPLKASLDRIWTLADNAKSYSSNVIIDLTSFPKRWFFPLIQMLYTDPEIENLVAIYSSGSGYASVISENPEPLRPLPGFPYSSSSGNHDLAFVGVGQHLLNIGNMFDGEPVEKLKLIFPTPPGPPGTRRNWSFVESLRRNVKLGLEGRDNFRMDTLRVSAVDVSQAFDLFRAHTNNGAFSCKMAPYGPKPLSLAMCLYSLACDEHATVEGVPVLYAQPQRYDLQYTSGPKIIGNEIEAHAYVLKHGKRQLYTLS